MVCCRSSSSAIFFRFAQQLSHFYFSFSSICQVQSGDSIIVRGQPKGGPPPEKQINLGKCVVDCFPFPGTDIPGIPFLTITILIRFITTISIYITSIHPSHVIKYLKCPSVYCLSVFSNTQTITSSSPPPAYLIAPKISRKLPDGTYTEDEPYAWEAREFLRKRLVGKEVAFRVEYKLPFGRFKGLHF